MKLGERIVAQEERLKDLRDEVADIIKSAEDDGRELLGDETDQIEALEGEIEAAEKALRGLKLAEKSLARSAEAREKGVTRTGNLLPGTVAKNEAPGALLSKMATVTVLAHIKKTSPDAIIAERYAHDPRVGEFMKAATNVATTTAAGWAAELVTNDLLAFMQDLEAVSIYGAMAAGGVAIPFGNNNSVTVPKRSGSGNVSGSFVGENASIPVKADNYGSTTFNRYKAAVISTFTEELARTSTPQIEGLLRDAIRGDTGDMLDNVLTGVGNAAIAGIRPASPWNGAATQASAGDDLASILTDLRFLLDTLSAANAGRNPRIIMNPARLTGLSMLTNANGSFVFRDEISQGRLMGIPLTVSTNCPAALVYIIDLADFGTAFGTPEFSASDQVTLAMASDVGAAPVMTDENAVSTGGSINISDAAGTTPPTEVRSMFQTYSIALRMILPISWGMMRPNVTAYLTGVSW